MTLTNRDFHFNHPLMPEGILDISLPVAVIVVLRIA